MGADGITLLQMGGVGIAVVAAIVASLLCSGALLATRAHHGWLTLDHPGAAIQATHATAAPRIGGIGIYLAVLIVRLCLSPTSAAFILDVILFAGIAALAVGLLEDVTRNVRPTARLAVTAASALACSAVTGISITRLDIECLDIALQWTPLALLLTAVAVAGMANAINIIDGFHGLASGTATIALAALAIVSALVGDAPLAAAALVLAGAIVGFWLVNFPWGKLFLGDGGAYFAGFALGWLAVLLPLRNPAVSPWASLLICGYPVIEVLYSIVRRLRGRRSPGAADCAHLHSLVAARIVRRHWARLDPTLQNSAVSLFMWVCAAIPALIGVTLYRHTSWLALGAAVCILLYHCLYQRLTHR